VPNKTKVNGRRGPYKTAAKVSDLQEPQSHEVATSAFVLREDGEIQYTAKTNGTHDASQSPELLYRNDERGAWVYRANTLELLDAIAKKYPEGRFDMIFADPPYFYQMEELPATPDEWSKLTRATGTNQRDRN
jgi:hypothetical protein